MGIYAEPKIVDSGISCLVVEFADCIAMEANASVQALKTHILKRFSARFVRECVPTYRSLAINYDPHQLSRDALMSVIRELLELKQESQQQSLREVVEVPVCYGGEYGPDLDFIAEHTKLSQEEVIKRHCAPTYYCYMLGFTPGFCYIGGMDEQLTTPRLSNPRTSIPMGSVGIAGKQTGIYPIASPGGWQLLGRTPLRLFDPQRNPITLIQAGEWVRFKPIEESLFAQIEKDVALGQYQPIRVEEPCDETSR